MDQDTFLNWKRIKYLMEQQNKTNNEFYQRACIIVKTGRDPHVHKNGKGRN